MTWSPVGATVNEFNSSWIFFALFMLLFCVWVLTQESIICVWSEQFLGTVEIKSEWQEDFHVRFVLEQSLVEFLGIFQLIYANCVFAFSIAHSIQWIQNLFTFIFMFNKREKCLEQIFRRSFSISVEISNEFLNFTVEVTRYMAERFTYIYIHKVGKKRDRERKENKVNQ